MYGTVGELKEISQVNADDLYLHPATGQTVEERFNELLLGFLRTAKDYIDRDRDRDFNAEGTVPEGIKSVALRLAANMVYDLIERQDSKMVKRDEQGNSTFRPTKIFTEELRWELSLYKKGSQLPSAAWPRFSRVRSPEDIYWDSRPIDMTGSV